MSASRAGGPAGSAVASGSGDDRPRLDVIWPSNFILENNSPELVQMHILIGPARWGYWQWSIGAYDPVLHHWTIHHLQQEMPGIRCRRLQNYKFQFKEEGFPHWTVAARPVTKLYASDLEWLWQTVHRATEFIVEHNYNSEMYVKMILEKFKQDDEINKQRQITLNKDLERYSGVINKPPNPEDDPNYRIPTPPG